ncbi:hypothetical protein COO60DRAFT_417417 [Scenedesmus sp. NREL 46B-D3]|nr:hypothetical protein COO60DRAFT_417417 [Scenedesmus sp. NREL 46B-D3]
MQSHLLILRPLLVIDSVIFTATARPHREGVGRQPGCHCSCCFGCCCSCSCCGSAKSEHQEPSLECIELEYTLVSANCIEQTYHHGFHQTPYGSLAQPSFGGDPGQQQMVSALRGVHAQAKQGCSREEQGP